jgi:IS5 family transposase
LGGPPDKLWRGFSGERRTSPEKLVNPFEPRTEVIRKGKASKPTSFGNMLPIEEAENQIVTVYEVLENGPATVIS